MDRVWDFDHRGLVLVGEVTEEQWKEIGRSLSRTNGAVLWALGDWLLLGFAGKTRRNHGRARWLGSDYLTAQYITGLSPARLSAVLTVARAFPRGRRVEGVSWTHHRACVTLPPDIADAVLARASLMGQTVLEMEAHFPARVVRLSRRKGVYQGRLVRCPTCKTEFPIAPHKVLVPRTVGQRRRA